MIHPAPSLSPSHTAIITITGTASAHLAAAAPASCVAPGTEYPLSPPANIQGQLIRLSVSTVSCLSSFSRTAALLRASVLLYHSLLTPSLRAVLALPPSPLQLSTILPIAYYWHLEVRAPVATVRPTKEQQPPSPPPHPHIHSQTARLAPPGDLLPHPRTQR